MSHRRLNLHHTLCLVSAKFQTISMYICVCLMWNNVSFEHVHIVFYVHMNSSRVIGCHDVWVIRSILNAMTSSARQCGVMVRLG